MVISFRASTLSDTPVSSAEGVSPVSEDGHWARSAFRVENLLTEKWKSEMKQH